MKEIQEPETEAEDFDIWKIHRFASEETHQAEFTQK